jgi:hypothetical protein
MIEFHTGTFRHVILAGRLALKLPRLRNFATGMQCNRWEREMWRTWQPKFRWENLCPIKFADRFGLVVVMLRARQPVTQQEVEAADPDCYPDIDVEWKPENWGRVNDRMVAIDYGLWDGETVRKRRDYLRSKDGPALCSRASASRSLG